MMSGSIQRSTSVVIGANGPTPSNGVSLSPTSSLQSPLQIFVRAKKRINDVFGELELYINEAHKFLLGWFKTFLLILFYRIYYYFSIFLISSSTQGQ